MRWKCAKEAGVGSEVESKASGNKIMRTSYVKTNEMKRKTAEPGGICVVCVLAELTMKLT